MTVVAAFAVAAVFVTAAFGAIAAIAAEIVVISARAAVLVLACSRIYTSRCGNTRRGHRTASHRNIAHSDFHRHRRRPSRIRMAHRSARHRRSGRSRTAVPAIARGTRAMPIPTIAVLAAVGAANPMLVIDTTGKPIAFAEAAIYDNLAGRILAATFRTNEAAI